MGMGWSEGTTPSGDRPGRGSNRTRWAVRAVTTDRVGARRTGGYNPKKHIKGSAAFLQETLAAAKPGETDLELAQDYINLRIAWRYERVKFVPSQKKFLQGWLNRDNNLKLYVAQLAPMFGQ
jgi:hypothetical protein